MTSSKLYSASFQSHSLGLFFPKGNSIFSYSDESIHIQGIHTLSDIPLTCMYMCDGYISKVSSQNRRALTCTYTCTETIHAIWAGVVVEN